MTKANKLFSMFRLQRCVWLFVVLWLVEQQNVRSSEAPAENVGTSELKLSGEFPVDTLGKLHAEAAAQQEITASKMAMRLLSKKQTHLIALFVLFLILMKVISVRMEKERKKAEEERLKAPTRVETKLTPPAGPPAGPPPKVSPAPQPVQKLAWLPAILGGPGKDASEKRGTRGRKTKKHGRKDKVPELPPIPVPAPGAPAPGAPAPGTPAPGAPAPGTPAPAPGVEHPVPPEFVGEQPYGEPAYGPVPIIEDDGEVRELRARMGVVQKLVDVAVRLVDELPQEEAKSIVQALKEDAAAAEQEERNYDSAKAVGDPNFESIRSQTVMVLKSSLDRARGALVKLSKLAKEHGAAQHAYCSTGVSFTNVQALKEPLEDSLAAAPLASCSATLSSMADTSITLQQESEDSARILRTLEFADECDAESFLSFYSSIATLNNRKETLTRLSDLGKYLKELLLDMHKAFMKSKIQVERTPVGMQGNLVQAIHTIMVKSRPVSEGKSGSGVKKAELQRFSDLFSAQTKELRALDTSPDFEAVTRAYKSAHDQNEQLKSLLDEQMKKMNAILIHDPLNKEETATAAPNLVKIGGTVNSVAEEFSRAASTALELATSKAGDVGAGLLQKLTKSKATVDLAGADVCVGDAVKAAFTELGRQMKTEAKNLSSKAQEIVESNKKEVKYRLDGEGLVCSTLEKKTSLKADAAQGIGNAKLLQLQLRYSKALAREIGHAESTQRAVSMFPFRPESEQSALLSELKEKLENEKCSAREAQNIEAIAEAVATIQTISLKMWKVLEQERFEQHSADIRNMRAILHDAGRQ